LLEAIADAEKNAAAGDRFFFSPAGSSLDRFESDPPGGERLYQPAKSISWGLVGTNPNINGEFVMTVKPKQRTSGSDHFRDGVFLRENSGANPPQNHTSRKDATSANSHDE